MAKTTVLRGAVKFKEISLTQSLTNRILSIASDGTLTDRPAIDTSLLLTTTLPSAQILVGNGSNIATAVAMSGDITINNAGVTAIGAGVIVNADVNAAAAIAYSKLNLVGSIVNTDINASAAIAYSKLNLATSIVNADVAVAAAIVRTKLASGNNYRILANSATGVMSENVVLTANSAIGSDANGQLQASATTFTQLGYSSNLTGDIQTQINTIIAGKATSALLQSPTGTENGFAITWDDGLQQWSLTDPVVQGIPIGGSARQFLGKNTGTSYDASWLDLVVGDLTDTSVLPADLDVITGLAAALVTPTIMSYLGGATPLTSSVQAQLNAKQSSSLAQNAIWVGDGSNIAAQLAGGTSGYVLTSVSGVPQWQPPTSLADGDKGDIVVSGSGATWTIDIGLSKAWTGAHSFLDNNFSLLDNSDNTKVAKFQVSGISTLTTRTFTFQDADGTLYQTGGADVAVADGGTNISSYAVGDLLYASGATTLSKLADVAVGNVLLSGGVTTAPAYGKVTSSHVDSTILTSTTGWKTTGSTTITTPTIVGNPHFEGNVLVAGTGHTISANTRFEVHGPGTTTQHIVKLYNNGPILRVSIRDDGEAIFDSANTNCFRVTTDSTAVLNNAWVMRIGGGTGLIGGSTSAWIDKTLLIDNARVTGAINQIERGIEYSATHTLSHTGATVTGIYYNPTITGAETASSTHYATNWQSGLHFIKNHGTTVPASPADGVTLYAEDLSSSSKLKLKDEAGNTGFVPIVLYGSNTLNFGTITAGAKEDLTITVTGAAVGDPVIPGIPHGSVDASAMFMMWVSAANTVTVRCMNFDVISSIDPASGTFKATVIKQ